MRVNNSQYNALNTMSVFCNVGLLAASDLLRAASTVV